MRTSLFTTGVLVAAALSAGAFAANTKDGSVNASDRNFMEKAAMGGMAEVELGNLAKEKAANAQVKEFGAKMVQDHGKAGDELKQIASSKGVTLPTTMGAEHKREMDKLGKLS